MNFKELIGQKFQETAFFDQVQFEVESNLEYYLGKDWHLFFKRIPDGLIEVTEVIQHADKEQLDPMNKAFFFIKEWIYLRGKQTRVSIQLCRLDRSGRLASVQKDHTHVQEGGICYADEFDHLPRLTPEERREAFRELAGIFAGDIEDQELRQKKAV